MCTLCRAFDAKFLSQFGDSKITVANQDKLEADDEMFLSAGHCHDKNMGHTNGLFILSG